MQPQYAYQTAPANFMPMMAGGGLADAAKQVQSQGRGGDTVLVHMTPGEVRGLQALALAQGGSLTTNPTTGLPEANILKSLLPAIAGAALNYFLPGVGTAIGGTLGLSGAAGTGIAIGGLTALATGSLKKGLMAGLGAYGGAGLSQGLVTPSTPSEAAVTVADKSPILAQPRPTGLEAALQPKPIPGISTTYGADTMIGAQGAVPPTQLGIGKLGVGPTTAQIVAPPIPTTSMLAAPPVSAVPQVTAPTLDTAVSTAVTPKVPMATKDLLKYGAAAISPAMVTEPKTMAKPDTFYRPYEFAWNPNTQAYEPSPTPGDTSERRYFSPTYTALPIQRAAQGGQIVNPMDEMTEDGGYAQGGETGLGALAKKRRSMRGDPYYKFAQDRRDSSMEASVDQNFAAGGLPPRFLSGGGDGMSDSIKANIDGKQEARLADGEFVVPADVVSHLGNGSSKAGAKKLYSMMDRIRKARTGKTRQAPEVNALKHMPA